MSEDGEPDGDKKVKGRERKTEKQNDTRSHLTVKPRAEGWAPRYMYQDPDSKVWSDSPPEEAPSGSAASSSGEGAKKKKKQKKTHEKDVVKMMFSRFHRWKYCVHPHTDRGEECLRELQDNPLLETIVDDITERAASGELQKSSFGQKMKIYAGFEDYAVW